MGHSLRLIWVSDTTSQLSMVNWFLYPIVQTRSGRSGNKESRSYWGAVAPCPGIQSGRLAHQMAAQGFEGRHQRTFTANELLSPLRNKLLRNWLKSPWFR